MACTTPLEKALNSDLKAIKNIVDNSDVYELQILYTQIDTTSSGEILFTDYHYKVNDSTYFYPASTVKLPVAILAAEFMDASEKLSLDIPYISKRDSVTHRVIDDITAIFAVSDNEAYNRLYEILGRDYINAVLSKKGLGPTRIAHRLSTTKADKSERVLTKFFTGYNEEPVVLQYESDKPVTPLKIKSILKGSGHMIDTALLEAPMDFSVKNYYPLKAQHHTMKRLIFPEKFKKEQRFNLTKTTRKRILNAMKAVPRNAGYKEDEYKDSYVKFFIYGDQDDPIPEYINIYNKVGYAYGTITETAYIEDTKEHVNFLLSATLLVNQNKIFNDNKYEYDSVGIPFLAQLGRELHKLEIKRSR